MCSCNIEKERPLSQTVPTDSKMSYDCYMNKLEALSIFESLAVRLQQQYSRKNMN